MNTSYESKKRVDRRKDFTHCTAMSKILSKRYTRKREGIHERPERTRSSKLPYVGHRKLKEKYWVVYETYPIV